MASQPRQQAEALNTTHHGKTHKQDDCDNDNKQVVARGVTIAATRQ